MEDTSGPVVQAPFGEGAFSELISGWLDEGDRLSESAAAAPVPPAAESRLGHAVRYLQPVIQRHRLSVLVGLGLLPLALLLGTRGGGQVPITLGPATVIPAILDPVAARGEGRTSPGAQLSPAPSAEAQAAPVAARPTSAPPAAPASAGSAAPPASAPPALANAGSTAPKAASHEHHHHHHHHHQHAASARGNAVTSAGRAVRR